MRNVTFIQSIWPMGIDCEHLCCVKVVVNVTPAFLGLHHPIFFFSILDLLKPPSKHLHWSWMDRALTNTELNDKSKYWQSSALLTATRHWRHINGWTQPRLDVHLPRRGLLGPELVIWGGNWQDLIKWTKKKGESERNLVEAADAFRSDQMKFKGNEIRIFSN